MKITSYRAVIQDAIDKALARAPREPGNALLDKMYELLQSCQSKVRRIAKRRNKDADQAGVSVVGDLFAWGTAYLLKHIKSAGHLPSHLCFEPRPKKHEIIESYGTIKVGGEILKPDIDLLIYSTAPNKPLVFVNMKTSLRERAGQTHRWKMVLDVALHCRELKEKYQLKYEAKKTIKFAFATTNFYNELNNPQHRAAIRFFDYVYLARDDRSLPPSVQNLSAMINDLQEIFA